MPVYFSPNRFRLSACQGRNQFSIAIEIHPTNLISNIYKKKYKTKQENYFKFLHGELSSKHATLNS